MSFISTKAHAVLDYLAAVALIIVPLFWLNDAAVPEAAVWVPVVAGVVMLLQAMITDYELSTVNFMPMGVHLGMDALLGIVVAASPWLFGFSETVWIPHVVVGVLEIGAALTTKTQRSIPVNRHPGHQVPA